MIRVFWAVVESLSHLIILAALEVAVLWSGRPRKAPDHQQIIALTDDEIYATKLAETFNGMLEMILHELLPRVARWVGLSGSDWRSTDEKHPALYSFLEALDCDKLSRAAAGLLAFERRMKSLKHSQVLKIDPPQYQDRGDGNVLLPYQYRELEEGQIRILELFPGARTDPLRCRLVHVSTGDPGDFEAVSYTWGTEEPTCPIQVDGQSHLIRPNLEAALIEFRAQCHEIDIDDSHSRSEDQFNRTLGCFTHALQAGLGRGHDSTRRLWIDAICINQNDVYERNSQIRFMTQLFSSSKRLLVWLGAESQGSNEAMDFIHQLGLKTLQDKQAAEAWFLECSKRLSFQRTFESVSHLLTRPWFSRAWVLQEYTLGITDDSLFMCGDKAISNQILEAAFSRDRGRAWILPMDKDDRPEEEMIVAEFVRGLSRFLHLREGNYNRQFSDLLKLRNGQTGPYSLTQNQLTLPYWLEVNRTKDASDPRDKVCVGEDLFSH
jgi:hypothetical protein